MIIRNYKGIILSDNGDGSFTVEDWDCNTRTFGGDNAFGHARDYADYLTYILTF